VLCSVSRLSGFLKIGLATFAILSLTLWAPEAEAARGEDISNQFGTGTGSGDDLTRQIQEQLTEMGFYSGPLDGKANKPLTRAIKAYQKQIGHKADGLITEDLLEHMETQARVGVMLNNLNRVRKQRQEEAREALLQKEETRHLLNRDKVDEIADPTRDSTPCFRSPSEQCLLNEAVESAKAIHKNELRDWAFGEILVAQAKAGLLDDAISTVQRIGDARLIIVALRDIARAQASVGRVEEAQAAIKIIPNTFKRLEALSAIADIQLKSGNAVGAHETAAQIIRLSRDLENPLQRVTLLAQMAVVLAKVGDTDETEKALAEATELARSPELLKNEEDLRKGAALRHIASALAEIGQPMQALSLIEDVTGTYDRTAVLISAATALANAGETEAALTTAMQIESGRYQSVALGRIAVAFAKKKKLDEATQTVARALDATNDVEMPYARSYAIGQLALSLIEIGSEIDATTLQNAVDTAQEIENDRLRAHMLWKAAAALSQHGLTDELKQAEKLAQDATDAINSSLSQVWMLGDLASETLKKGQPDRAQAAFQQGLEIAEGIHNAWGRARALAKLATTLGDFR